MAVGFFVQSVHGYRELVFGFGLQLQGEIAEFVDLKAVLLVFLVVEFLQLVNGKFVELVEILPPLLVAAKFAAKISVRDVTAHSGSNVKSTHRQHVDAVARNCAPCRRDTLYNASVDVLKNRQKNRPWRSVFSFNPYTGIVN